MRYRDTWLCRTDESDESPPIMDGSERRRLCLSSRRQMRQGLCVGWAGSVAIEKMQLDRSTTHPLAQYKFCGPLVRFGLRLCLARSLATGSAACPSGRGRRLGLGEAGNDNDMSASACPPCWAADSIENRHARTATRTSPLLVLVSCAVQ